MKGFNNHLVPENFELLSNSPIPFKKIFFLFHVPNSTSIIFNTIATSLLIKSTLTGNGG